jgi:hypothetical protein
MAGVVGKIDSLASVWLAVHPTNRVSAKEASQCDDGAASELRNKRFLL